VLVHGAWHGAWCWARVTPLLDAAGVAWVAAELPSCATPPQHSGLPEDVHEVERLLDELPGIEPAVLVGHSRGGLVISEAGTHPGVGELVYLCAFLLEPDVNPAPMLAAISPGRAAISFPCPLTRRGSGVRVLSAHSWSWDRGREARTTQNGAAADLRVVPLRCSFTGVRPGHDSSSGGRAGCWHRAVERRCSFSYRGVCGVGRRRRAGPEARVAAGDHRGGRRPPARSRRGRSGW